jgi:hypothetical protein
MPVTPAYTWKQSDDNVIISISSVHITKANLNLFGMLMYTLRDEYDDAKIL